MNESIKIKPDKGYISDYIDNFEKGNLQVPAFQRDFLWDNDKKLRLFESIKKGYPIGSVLLWQPAIENLEIFENFNGKKLGEYYIPQKINSSLYILDGFQRLSTLIGCLLHPDKAKIKGIVRDDEEWFKEFNIIYNLKDEEFEISRTKDYKKLNFYQVPIYKLVDGKEFFQFQKNLFDDEEINSKYIERYEEMSLIFQKYEIPNINLYGGSISEAIEIFQRLNSQGARITTDWVISASLIERDPSFRLGDEINNLIDNELKYYNFNTIKRDVILNCITNSFGGVYFDQVSKNDNKKIEILVQREDFISITKKTFEAIKVAAEFMFEELMILDAKLIPYNNQFIFITDFFNKVENPSNKQLFELKKWFWITTYSNYFTIYNLSKQRLAYNQFQKFIKDENTNPVYYDNYEEKFSTLNFPEKISMGSVRGKALALFMINYNVNLEKILESPNKINSDSIDGYKAFKLFIDKENMLPENTIFDFLRYNSLNNFSKNTKELRPLLDKNHLGKDLNLFLNDEMRNEFEEGKIDYILEIRKELIIDSERNFVERLGIDYYE